MAKPSLESLPAELLILILLEVSDLSSLRSIVLSSPICHQAYLTVRQEALCYIIKNQYGVHLADGILAVRSRGLDFTRHKNEAIALLDTWRRREEISVVSASSNRFDEPQNLEEILNLVHHFKVFQFFLGNYAVNAPRPKWIDHDQWETTILPIELSPAEKHRIFRALCRLQAFSNIFGPVEVKVGSDSKRIYNHWDLNEDYTPFKSPYEEVYRVFFGIAPSWEYEELSCIWAYLQTKFDPIYEEMAASLHALVKEHATRDDWGYKWFDLLPSDFQPPWWGDVQKLDDLETLREGSASLALLGPEADYRLLHATPLVQRDMVMLNADFFQGMCLALIPFLYDDFMRPSIYPADRYEVQDYKKLWSTLPSVEQPNLGWKRYFLKPGAPEFGFEDSFYQDYGERSELDWGYAIWDDERLKAWNAPLLEDAQND